MEAITGGIELTGTLYTSAQGEAKDKLAMAEQIYDRELGKFQSEINKEAKGKDEFPHFETLDELSNWIRTWAFEYPERISVNLQSTGFSDKIPDDVNIESMTDPFVLVKNGSAGAANNDIQNDSCWSSLLIGQKNTYIFVAYPIINSSFGQVTRANVKVRELASSTDLADKVDKEDGKGLSSNDYTDEDKTKLTSLPDPDTIITDTKLDDSNFVISDPTETELEDVEPNLLTEALRKTPQILTDSEKTQVLENLGNPEFKLFVDMWNKNCVGFGTYNAETNFFELNGIIDITYEEALSIASLYQSGRQSVRNGQFSYAGEVRTLFPILGYPNSPSTTVEALFHNSSKLETIRFFSEKNKNIAFECGGPLSLTFTFCRKLKKVEGNLSIKNCTSINSNAFLYCDELEEINLSGVKWNIKFPDSPKLSLNTLTYMVNNAANTSSITITVHPDIYAKLTDEEVSDYSSANLLINSGGSSLDTSFSDGHYMCNIKFGDIRPKTDDKVTITIWGELAKDKDCFEIHNTSAADNGRLGALSKISEGVYSATFTWREVGNNSLIYIYAMPNSAETGLYSVIDKVKLEFGENPNPVWTPAIEDIEDEELKEKIEWTNLVSKAASKNIQFATT